MPLANTVLLIAGMVSVPELVRDIVLAMSTAATVWFVLYGRFAYVRPRVAAPALPPTTNPAPVVMLVVLVTVFVPSVTVSDPPPPPEQEEPEAKQMAPVPETFVPSAVATP